MGRYFSYGYISLFVRLTHVISFLVWANWLVKGAMAQELSGAVSSTVSFLDAGLTTLGHIAAFTNCYLRGRLDVEMASRDLLVSLADPEEKLVELSGSGGSSNVKSIGTTSTPGDAGAILITTNTSNSVVHSFMQHTASCYGVYSLVLSFLPVRLAVFKIEECLCTDRLCTCWCLWATPEIMHDLVMRLPGNIKQVSPELYLVPSFRCFTAGCHGCSDGMLYRSFTDASGFSHGAPDPARVGALSAMIGVTNMQSIKNGMCVAVPTYNATDDVWSRLLLKIMSTKDEADRDLQMDVPEALDLYIKGQRSPMGIAHWSLSRFSFLFPRFIEMVLNLVLTGWFRVDGFSSALVARRTVRNYVTNSIGNGLHAGAFLSRLDVIAHSSNVHICQRLQFRGPLESLRAVALMGASVNAISTIWWMVAVALGKGLGSWSTTYTHPPSPVKLFALVGGIALALAMDTAHAYLNWRYWKKFPLLYWATMGVQLLVLLALASTLGVLGVAVFGTWIFAVIQALAWMKWVVGVRLLSNDVINQASRANSGIIVYSSAFLLTAILAAVGGSWS